MGREPDSKDEAIRYYEAAKKSGVLLTEATLGMTFTFGHTTFRVLGIKNEELKTNPYNNSSMVIKAWDPLKSVLFLGDLGKEAGDKLLEGSFHNQLDCDYMQTRNTIDALNISENYLSFEGLIRID
jgi:beta-lactamase superfamily II metal-dependent hydrolase